ncbi:BZ3500_MvSof-1268-A1-R1_Chr4-3g07265 [Microbotryum saponariae]|uniref:Autophagy-related protein 14 n=1 Tax=Microbotryum saponariae TaxID=289078 RepID=A0A2X0LNP7_9BASI|nr:BZ3500_MvSof-1268-A1-R1_Chr4-3g07265 [Microbotryum saponariae]SDA06928.1 BZ3501_MvSof-1269-A2-R1_Chr4-2g06974 [Microbotryum saponariae]
MSTGTSASPSASPSVGPTPPGTCAACHRGGSNRLFYCAPCLEQRLEDHYSRRQHAQRLTQLSQARASALLDPPPASSAWPVSDERRQKADKWAVAVQVKQISLANESVSATINQDRVLLQQRRSNLTKRRENLVKARRLLAQTSPSHHTATLAHLASIHQDLLARLGQVRTILTNEALVVFAFQPSDIHTTRPSPPTPNLEDDPFQSTLAPTTATPLAVPPPPPRPPQAYTLANLPLPPLSMLPTLPLPYLNALLSHLAQLTRLMAIYYDLELPFTPLPALYGPGRPGVKASLSSGVFYAGVETVSAGRTDEKSPNTGGCWPLFLSTTAAASTSTAPLMDKNSGGERSESKHVRQNTSALRALETWTHLQDDSFLFRRSQNTITSTSTSTAVQAASSERLRSLMVGIVALAFDWEWIARTRGKRVEDGVNKLDDWVALIKEATKGVEAESFSTAKDDASTQRPQAGRIEMGFTFAQAVDHFWAKLDATMGPVPKMKNAGGGKSSTRTRTKERWNKVEREPGGEGVERAEEERGAEAEGEEEGWDLV